MTSYSLRGALIAGCLVLLFAGGCGKSENPTVATVGDYEIKAAEVDEYLARLRMTFPSSQEEYNKRRELVDSLIITRLLIQGAYEMGIDQSPEVAQALAANQQKFLMSSLYEKHIAGRLEPTDAEVQDYYNRLEHRVRASHILVTDLDTARALFERIMNGENFEQLAFDYSIDPDAKRNKGDLGYFLWGATVDAFQETAFSMEPGEVSPPVKSRFGYHIIKVVDKQPNESRQDFATMERSIRSQITMRRSATLTQEYFDLLKTRYPVVIDTSTCEYLMHKREVIYPPVVLANLPRNDFDLEALDRNEKELIIATWAGNQMPVFEYLDLLKRRIPARFRPDLDHYDSLASIVFEMKKEDILIKEALAEGLDNEEHYLQQVRVFKELNMADIMKNDSIATPPPPDDAALREYYEQNIAEFTTGAKIHIHEILLSDELTARQLVREIKSLNDFKKKATELTERPGRRGKGGDMGYIEKKWYPDIFEIADNTAIGRIGGPVLTGGKYSIFYVVDRIEPEIKDFLSVKRNIADKVTRQRKEDAIHTWVDERMKVTEIEIDEKALWDTIDEEKYVVVAVDTTGA
ncbi:MAG: peptidylprolyl isomerase [Candidatus Zixiibacteriota bacterium]|nr:MAG: peptidylprolyl isomerase [candidate division Zixibacteria bacterium]